jgi:clan AA aspartic protease
VQVVETPLTRDQAMGEVRTAAELTNAIDEGLERRGQISREQVRTYRADALVDTGAVRTVLPAHVAEQLGLAIVGERVAEYADGRLDVVGLTEPVKIDIVGRTTVEQALVLGNEVIIGQTVLETIDMQVDCSNRRLVPNPAHPDQPVVKIK